MAMLEMADNPAIMLFTRMLHNYGFSEASYMAFVDRPDRIEEHRSARIELGEAILDGDVDLAARISEKLHDVVKGWMTEAAGGPDVIASEFQLMLRDKAAPAS